MSIIHDLAEAVVGDIPPSAKMLKEEKHTLEKNGMLQLMSFLGDTESANEIYELWMEYENATTPEALFVKDVDKFEMILQAFEYEKSTFCIISDN